MKKLMIPCLAATLLLGSTIFADQAGATSSNKGDVPIKFAHNSGKSHGLYNALERGNKSERAKEVIQRNIEKKEAHQKWKEEKEKLKWDKKKDKAKDYKDKEKKDKKDEKADLSLRTFTVGGVDVSKLSGLTTKEGAILKVADFKDFTGINVEVNGDNAHFAIFLNGYKIHEDYIKNIHLRDKDVIVVQVKDGKETKKYKLTLEQKLTR